MSTGQRTVLVAARFEFAAGHTLPHHAGKCRQPHGHNYVLEVGVRGTPRPADGSPSEGMVVDFADIKHTVQDRVLAHLDHRSLNDALPAEFQPPTAEHVALWVWESLGPFLSDLALVRLWETSSAYVEVRD